MGIYRNIHFTDDKGHPTTLEYAMGQDVTVTVSEPGIELMTVIKAESWTEKRTDCFCCSCGDFSADPACRNHGFAGKRPCEEHGTAGSTWDEEMSPGLKDVMPYSVQETRRRNQELSE